MLPNRKKIQIIAIVKIVCIEYLLPQDAGVPIDHLPAIAIDPQEAGLANPNPDAHGLPPQNLKRSPPKVKSAGPKRDVIMPEFQPNSEERDPEIDRRLEWIPQDKSNSVGRKELPNVHARVGDAATRVGGTVEALFDIIANAATLDNKREADSG
uniref:Uncharacterized protein n=1 Tax=Romanomermis culicivorax TaxID=13658 RepID=A0A915IKA2_ROMCU